MGRRRNSNDGTQVFKSKNLEHERTRREKLNSRMLQLRAIVPIITDAMIQNYKMKKATIITDAISYIMEMRKMNEALTDLLREIDEDWPEQSETNHFQVDAAEEMEILEIEPEITMTCIDGRKHWIKIVFKKKRGGLTKLLEAMGGLGINSVDITVTTCKGAVLVTSCIEEIQGGMLEANQVQEFLAEIIEGI